MSKHVGQRCGDYRLTVYLGQGGFAEVYLGEHLFEQGKKAAVKILKRGFSPEEMEEFRYEAQTITHLKHPRIVRLSAFGETIISGDRFPFLVMDYAPHGSLDKRHPRNSKLPLETILPYMKQLAEALLFAHEQQIVHRDIKPANFLLAEDEKVLLSDFGIAVLVHQDRSLVEQKLVGSWQYAAPEHFDGKAVPASDQYALGVVMYQWLCGELPFQGDFIQLTHQHHFVSPPPLHEKIPITPLFEAVIMRALSKKPEERFASVQDFVFALEYASQEEMTASKRNVAIGTTQLIYGGLTSIEALAWSPDGTRINAASRERIVQTWDARSGKMLGLCDKKHLPDALGGRSRWGYPYSPDGQYIAHVSSDGAIRLQAVTSDEARYLSKSGSKMAWSSNGRLVASVVTETNTARGDYSRIEVILIRDVIAGTILCTCRERSNSGFPDINTVEWSPDGQHIAASYNDETLRIWDVIRGKRLRRYQYMNVHEMAWSPNGQFIAYNNADRKTIYVWNPFEGKVLCSYREDPKISEDSSVYWSPNGKYIGFFRYNYICVFDAMNGNVVFNSDLVDRLSDLAWSPDGTLLASGSSNGKVQVWNPAQKTTLWTVDSNNGHSYSSSRIHELAWSPNGLLLASASDHDAIRVWGSRSGKTYCTRPLQSRNTAYSPQDSFWKTSIWSPDGTRIASRVGRDAVEIWNPTNATSRISLSQGNATETWALPLLPQTSINGMAWSPDGKRMASANSQNGTVSVQNSSTRETLSTYQGHVSHISTSSPLHPQVVAWSPDGQCIASSDPDDRTIHIWNPENGKLIWIYHGYSEQVRELIWSPDSEHIVSFGLDKKDLYVWNPARGETLCIYSGHQTLALSNLTPIQALIWSPDGQRIASVGYQDKAVHIWNPTNGATIYIYNEHVSPVQSLAWSYDGGQIASAGDEVRIWQAM